MDSSKPDLSSPHWMEHGLPPHLSSLARVQESVDAAVVGVRQVTRQALGDPSDDLTASGEMLASSLEHLRQALVEFVARGRSAQPAPPEPAKESGFDESKLLASIEKWQRRFHALEAEHSQLLTENEALHARCAALEAVQDAIAVRVERSLATLDALLAEEEEEDADEEYRNHHQRT